MNLSNKIMELASEKGFNIASNIFKVVIIAVIGLLIIHIVNKALEKFLNKSKMEKAAHSLLKTVARTVMYILLILIIASSLGIDVTGVVALASVLTLAVSLSLQDMLSNVIGGFTLIYTKPFASGDYVEIAGQAGTVAEISIAYTKLTTLDNKIVSIPNKAVVASEIVNYTALGTRRIDITVAASYDADSKAVIDALLKAAESEKILDEPEPFATVSEYGDSSIEYLLRIWTKSSDYWDVYFSTVSKLKTVFDEHNIEMTYPHLNVHIDK